MSHQLFETTYHALQRTHTRALLSRRVVNLLQIILIALLLVSSFGIANSDYDTRLLGLVGIIAIGFMAIVLVRRYPPIASQSNWLLSLEMKYPHEPVSPLSATDANPHNIARWHGILESEKRGFRKKELLKSLTQASTLVAPLALLTLALLYNPVALEKAIQQARTVASHFTWGAQIRILSGKASDSAPDVVRLSSGEITRIELLDQNLIAVELNGFYDQKESQIMELRETPGEHTKDGLPKLLQSFQLTPVQSTEEKQEAQYRLSLAVNKSADLYVPAVSKNKPLAEIIVKTLPVPRVKLSTSEYLSEEQPEWIDNKPLPLQIGVEAENPLQLVRLLIVSGKRTSQELINSILATDVKEISLNYDLLLEPYVDSDVADVEIIAEAVDRAVPSPLVGRSEPLRLKTVSSYGRYRQALNTLKEIKGLVDEAMGSQKGRLKDDAKKMTKTLEKQVEDSPYFDGLDRMQINNFMREVNDATASTDQMKIADLSEKLNDFLFEHEALDLRERDRDFFVAVRGLSRLIEQNPGTRTVAPSIVTQRIEKFLTERMKFWDLRVKRMPAEFRPSRWNKIRDEEPFHKAMRSVAELTNKKVKAEDAKALVLLTKSVAQYREWIELLEEAEEKSRSKKEQDRQEGLASARNELRELQTRQGNISQYLDRADTKSKDDLNDNWPASRGEQNTNIQKAKGLEAKVRALSPPAAERLKFATESMQTTLDNAEKGDFAQAESSSDLASRLLRQAESAAQQSQREKGDRGRRRRMAGDRYYGQSVMGSDIEIQRDYRVDKRYRDDILNEVTEMLNRDEEASKPENRRVLEDYLNEVVR